MPWLSPRISFESPCLFVFAWICCIPVYASSHQLWSLLGYFKNVSFYFLAMWEPIRSNNYRQWISKSRTILGKHYGRVSTTGKNFGQKKGMYIQWNSYFEITSVTKSFHCTIFFEKNLNIKRFCNKNRANNFCCEIFLWNIFISVSISLLCSGYKLYRYYVIISLTYDSSVWEIISVILYTHSKL